MRRKANTDVGDQVRPSWRTLLDDVEHVAPVHHGEVSTLAQPVDEVCEQRVPEPAQRLLPREPAGQLECGDPESIAPGFGQVNDEPALLQHAEQMVDG